MNLTSPKDLEVFSLNFITDAIAKNSSRTVFGEKIGLIPGLIFPAIVRPYSLKTPTYRISLENDKIVSHFFLLIVINLDHNSLFIYFVKLFKLINHVKHRFVELNKEKINQLLNSDVVNYLETSERLVLKNILEKEIISKNEIEDLDTIIEKYKKFIKD